MIVEIASPTPIRKTFDYKVNGKFSIGDPSDIIGRRVEIPFGFRKKAVGIVFAVKEKSDAPQDKLKSITSILDSEPLLNEHQIELARWLSKRYVSSFGEALFAMLPPGKGNVRSFKEPEGKAIHLDYHGLEEEGHILTEDQKKAVQKIHESIFKRRHPGESRDDVFLLLGAAATGKTEVYMAAIKDVLEQGKSAIYLTPEIGLAVQTAEMLRQRFGNDQVLHWRSDVTPKKRIEDWWRIKRGDVSIIIGSRATALVPLPQLGLIVMDEEHDSAYKEDRKPRFQTRDVVLKRGELEKATVIFGSATPSLEIYKKAQDKEVQLIELDTRATRALAPKIKIVDLTEEKKRGVISERLRTAINLRLKNKEQVILFLNKRGFNRYLKCTKCEWIAKCPHCEVVLIQHKSVGATRRVAQTLEKNENPQIGRGPASPLQCHYCDHKESLPLKCPNCKNKKLISGGYGTQRVVSEIQDQFPWAKVLRWDRDSREHGSTDALYNDFKNGMYDILIGTVMIAQGFNFPKTTLVGVLDADEGLHFPDFHAAESTFQLMTQVAGRAGRAMKQGDVFFQTRNIDHYAIQNAAKMNYENFANEELKFRESLNYPPFGHIVHIKSDEKSLEKFITWLDKFEMPIGVLGPTPTRTKKQIVMLKIPAESLAEFLNKLTEYPVKNTTQFHINVDP